MYCSYHFLNDSDNYKIRVLSSFLLLSNTIYLLLLFIVIWFITIIVNVIIHISIFIHLSVHVSVCT